MVIINPSTVQHSQANLCTRQYSMFQLLYVRSYMAVIQPYYTHHLATIGTLINGSIELQLDS